MLLFKDLPSVCPRFVLSLLTFNWQAPKYRTKQNAIYLKNAIATYQEFYIPYLFGFLQFKVVGEAWVETEFKKEIKKGSKVFDPITGKLIID